jgi:4-hydroxybenzoate polyprenyltransferase
MAEPRTHKSQVRALALSCHPVPTVAVTALSAGLAALAHNSPGRAFALVAAVLTGQLSIGWSNDWIDAARDRASQRSDKPAALGAVPASTVAKAAWIALILSVVLSILLGHRSGTAAILILISGWAYNLGLKATVWSWLPYAIAFGALPVAATLNGPGSHWPGWWAMAAGASLGVAAHVANVLPDLATDAATGVRGFPHRLGARKASTAGPVLLVIATGLIVFGPAGHPSAPGWAAMAASVIIGAAALTTALRARTLGQQYFLATIAVAVIDLALFATSGGQLT